MVEAVTPRMRGITCGIEPARLSDFNVAVAVPVLRHQDGVAVDGAEAMHKGVGSSLLPATGVAVDSTEAMKKRAEVRGSRPCCVGPAARAA